MYNWSSALEACPDGWHIPSKDEWGQLIQFINDQKGPYSFDGDTWLDIGKHLKAKEGWVVNGTDDYGFSAIPGGGVTVGSFGRSIGDNIEWGGWCSNDDGAPRGEDFAWYLGITDLIYAEIFLTHISDGIKEGAASVRYLRD